MTWTRREMLASLGVSSAGAILLACGPRSRGAQRPAAVNPELGTWLRDAVARIAGAGLSAPHALAVSRRRATAALDVLGAGVARSRSDGLVLACRAKDGSLREQVTNDLSRAGILAAARELAGDAAPARVDFGAMPPVPPAPRPDPDELSDGQLLARAGALAGRDRTLSSRIVYAASVLDLDDARVWSVAPGRMLEQRLVRVRKSITRVAWHGTRPVASEAAIAWSGSIDARDLADEDIATVRDNALALSTPRAFEDGEHACVLEPAVAAQLIDVAVRALLTADAQRRPELANRLVTGAPIAEVLTVIDDPTTAEAYGAFGFDDRGELARPQPLVERGQLVGRIERGRRPGHVGPIESAPSHVRVAPGSVDLAALLDTGFMLEQPIGTLVDPASDRVIIQIARAREYRGGRRTGRVYADVELVGELSTLLATVGALSTQTRSIGIRDQIDGYPRWRSIETPWMRGQALLRQRRRAA